jgi:hypothetical protein
MYTYTEFTIGSIQTHFDKPKLFRGYPEHYENIM